MGTRAFSHDSIFIPDGGAESEQTFQAMSQDNILGKVKTLQVRQPAGGAEAAEGKEETSSLAPSGRVQGSPVVGAFAVGTLT